MSVAVFYEQQRFGVVRHDMSDPDLAFSFDLTCGTSSSYEAQFTQGLGNIQNSSRRLIALRFVQSFKSGSDGQPSCQYP
jgi:hypothetical protein